MKIKVYFLICTWMFFGSHCINDNSLKQIVHKYLPKEIMERPKMGFGIPLEKWLSEELKELVLEVLSKQNLQQYSLFNIDEVQKLLKQFLVAESNCI